MRRSLGRLSTLAVFLVLLGGLIGGDLHAASTATDSAADATYNGGWVNNSNGGSGWASWSLNRTSNDNAVAGFFIGTSAGNGSGDPGVDGDINTAGRAWGLYANSGVTATATRLFTGTLNVGQVFTISMDNGTVSEGRASFILRNSGGDAFEFFTEAVSPTYLVGDSSSTNRDSNIPVTDQGLIVAFTLTSISDYSVTVTPVGADGLGAPATFTGTVSGLGTNINRVVLRNRNACVGGGSLCDLFFNSMAISCGSGPACSITPTGGSQCQNAQSTYMGPAGMTTYGWSLSGNSSGASIAGANNTQTVTVNNGSSVGQYTLNLTVTQAGCTSSCSTVVSVGAGGSTAASNNGPVCEGSPLNLFATGPAVGVTYSWVGPNFSSSQQNPQITNAIPGNTGTYTVFATFTNGCSATAETFASVFNKPVTEASNDGPGCAGQNIHLFATGSGSFKWTGPNGFNSTVQNPTISDLSSNDVGAYCVVLTVNNCKSDSNCTTIGILEAPTVTVSNNAPICEGKTLKLFANGPTGAQYSWTGPNGFASTNRTPQIPNVTVANSGTYTVIGCVKGCCSAPVDSFAKVVALPVCSITGPTQVCALATSTYCGPGGDGFTYKWKLTGSGTIIGPKDAQCIDVYAPIAGAYTLSLTVSNDICGDKCTLDVVASERPVFLTTLLPNGALGVDYDQIIDVTGGTPPYTFSVIGFLPDGLTLDPDTGELFGTPTTVGTFFFCVSAIDQNGCEATSDPTDFVPQCYTIEIRECTPFVLRPQTLPDAPIGALYDQFISTDGGVPPLQFFRVAGQLPTGLTLTSDGEIVGTPTAFGTFTFEVKVFDSFGCSGERFYTVKVPCPTFTVTPAALSVASLGASYSQLISATGGKSPITFTQVSGSLPAGLSLSSSGQISGIPTSGSSVFTVRATDANGCGTNKTYTIIVNLDGNTLVLSPTSLSDAVAGEGYADVFSSVNGTAPFSFAVTAGSLPPGLTLGSDGFLSGTPKTQGSFTFIVTGTDANNITGSRGYTINVGCPDIIIDPPFLFDATVGDEYGELFTTVDGTGDATFAITAGALPIGLSLSSDGVFSGIVAQAGTFDFTITATDPSGCTVSEVYTIVISNPPGRLADVRVQAGSSAASVAVGGSVTYTFTVSNAGPSPATGVKLVNTVPDGAAFVGASGVSSVAGNKVTLDLGTLAVGHSAAVTVQLDALRAGDMVNAATSIANEGDPNLTNNHQAQHTMVVAEADVDLTGIGVRVHQKCGSTACSVAAKIALINRGGQDAPSGLVRFFLSNDATLSAEDTLLGQVTVPGVKAAKGRKVSVRAKLPASSPVAGRYVIAVIDPDNVMAETDKTNNRIVVGQLQ